MLEDDMNDMLEAIKEEMLKTEVETLEQIPDYSLYDLVNFYYLANEGIMNDSGQRLKNILNSGDKRKFGEEAIFSTFRLLRAVLAEIEYRIRENKI
jgi:hypothetical protein